MKLTSGKVTVPIERDGVMTGEISFDPQDVGFAESFYEMLAGLESREKQYRELSEKDTAGRIAHLGETCRWLGEQTERIFGEGSRKVAFGENLSPELFRQFFQGVEPFIKQARGKRTAKYREKTSGVME